MAESGDNPSGEVDPREPGPGLRERSAGPRRILVVEDQRATAKQIEASLRALGYEVSGVVSSGEEALRVVAQEVPDLIIMDILLAGPLSGIQTAAALRERYHLPIVYLTAISDDRTLSRATATAPYGYLLKPFTEREVRSVVELALYKHELETKNREREEWLLTTLASIGDAVVATDELGRVKLLNAAAEELLGHASEDAIGKTVDEVVVLLDETHAVLASPIASILDGLTEQWSTKATTTRPDGTRVMLECRARPIADKNTTYGVVLILRDVTEQRDLEARLLAADRMASLGTLAAGIAHEINNPLAYVIANVAFVAEEAAAIERAAHGNADASAIAAEVGQRGAALAEALEEARHGAERVRAFVRDLRAFSRVDDSDRGAVHVTRVVDSSVNIVWNHIRHRARLVKDYGSAPPVRINEARLGQVVVNLLINAAHAIPEGDCDAHTIRIVTGVDKQGRALLSIHDSGEGIAPQHLSRVFDPFFTTKGVGGGAGLGLSVCHGIVVGAGGEISVESEEGVGTVFRVALPGATIAATERPVAAPAPLKSRRARVLVVDDERLVLSSIRRTLRSQHEVVCVSDPLEALARITAGEQYDVLVCDLHMPNMTGMALHAQLQLRAPQLAHATVFVTGGAFSTEARRFLESVDNPRLEKPFDPEALRTEITRLISSPTPE